MLSSALIGKQCISRIGELLPNCIYLNVAKSIKDEIRNVISGKSAVRYGGIIQTIARYLENCARASEETRGTKQFKEQEAKALTHFANQAKPWLSIDFENSPE